MVTFIKIRKDSLKTPRLVREALSNCAGASYATEKPTPVRILIVLLGSIDAFRLNVLLSSICALRVLNVLLISRSAASTWHSSW